MEYLWRPGGDEQDNIMEVLNVKILTEEQRRIRNSKALEYWHKHKHDPKVVLRQRENVRKYRLKHKDDPEFKLKINLRVKRYKLAHKDDPEWQARSKEWHKKSQMKAELAGTDYYSKHKSEEWFKAKNRIKNRLRLEQDPEYAEKRRAYGRDYYAIHKNEQGFKEKVNARAKAFRDECKNDPIRRQQMKQKHREYMSKYAEEHKYDPEYRLYRNGVTRKSINRNEKVREVLSIKRYIKSNEDLAAIPVFQAMVGVSKIRELEHVN